MAYGDRKYRFPRKSRRCRCFDEDGLPIRGDECRSLDCYFAHPEDREWDDASISSRRRPPLPPPLPLDRRESLSSRGHSGRDPSRDRSRERGRAYSPPSRSRDKGWGDINRAREERRKSKSRGGGRRSASPPKTRREDSVASSREGDNGGAQSSPRRTTRIPINTAGIPTEPAAHRSPLRRKSTASIDTSSTMGVNAAPAPKLINIDVNSNLPPRPPSVTPSPIPPPPPTPSDTLEPLRSPAVLSSPSSALIQQQSRKSREQPATPSSVGGATSEGFVVPPLPPSAARATTPASSSRPAAPTATPTTSVAALPPVTSQEGADSNTRRGLDETRTPVIIRTPVLSKLRTSKTPNTGSSIASTATNISSSSPAASVSAVTPFTPVAPVATLAATPAVVTPTTTTTANTTMQPQVADVEMAPLDRAAGILGLTSGTTTDEAQASSATSTPPSAAAQPPAEAVSQEQQNQEQAEDVSHSPQQLVLSPLPPPPPLPPLPNLEVAEKTTPELSQEAKLDLWSKRVKTIAELLVHHDKVTKLTSDIDDLTRYASSSYFSASASQSNDEPEAKEEKRRIENNLTELDTARAAATQTMQKLINGLIVSDTWPSAPVIEDVRKQNAKVGEYVKALEDAMKKVARDLNELADLTRSLGAKNKKKEGTKKKKSMKGKEKAEEGEEEKVENAEGQEKKDVDMMDIDAEDSGTPTTTPTTHQPTTLDTDLSPGVDSEAESSDSDYDSSSSKTRRFYRKLQSGIHTLSEEVDTLRSTLDETESTWLQGTQELYSSLLTKHKSSLAKYRTSFESSLSSHTSSIKASLTQLSNDATDTSQKVDKVVQEEAELLERIAKLEKERDRLKEGQKKFFEEKLPEWKKKFEEYEKERERDAKRVSVLEAALNAFVKRPPRLNAPLTTAAAVGAAAAAAASMSAPTTSTVTVVPMTGAQTPSLPQNHSDPSQSPTIPSSSQPPPSNILSLLQPHLKHYLREQVKPMIEDARNQVEKMVNSQREEMRTVMWDKVELTWKVLDEIGKKVEVSMTMEGENASGSVGGSVQGEGGEDTGGGAGANRIGGDDVDSAVVDSSAGAHTNPQSAVGVGEGAGVPPSISRSADASGGPSV